MKTDDVQELSRFNKLIILAILLVVLWFAVIGLCSVFFHIYERMHQPPRMATIEMKAKMKYHGIQSAECGWDDRCYFYRDGKRIKL